MSAVASGQWSGPKPADWVIYLVGPSGLSKVLTATDAPCPTACLAGGTSTGSCSSGVSVNPGISCNLSVTTLLSDLDTRCQVTECRRHLEVAAGWVRSGPIMNWPQRILRKVRSSSLWVRSRPRNRNSDARKPVSKNYFELQPEQFLGTKQRFASSAALFAPVSYGRGLPSIAGVASVSKGGFFSTHRLSLF